MRFISVCTIIVAVLFVAGCGVNEEFVTKSVGDAEIRIKDDCKKEIDSYKTEIASVEKKLKEADEVLDETKKVSATATATLREFIDVLSRILNMENSHANKLKSRWEKRLGELKTLKEKLDALNAKLPAAKKTAPPKK